MVKIVALRRWLYFVAALRLLSVYIGIFDIEKFRWTLFDLQPTAVTDLYGRTFATWTLLTCALCIICARNPTNPAIYGATLISFLAALTHFTMELLVFKTMSIKGAASPMVVATLSSLWMGAGFNYYTKHCAEDVAAPPASTSDTAVKKDT